MVMLTGGEPTLYPDLIQVSRFFKQNQLRVKIATNGSNPAVIQSLLEEGALDELVISVDAALPATYEKVRGKNRLTKICRFVERNSQYANRIRLSFLIQRSNYKEIIPFLYWCKSLEIAKISLLVPHYNGDFSSLIELGSYRDKMFLSNEERLEFQNTIVPQLKDFYSNNLGMFTCSQEHMDALIKYVCYPDASYSFRSTICSFPLKSLFLFSDGKASLCPYHPNWKVNLDSLLNDLKAFRMRCVLEGGERASYCRRCLEVPL